MVRVMVIRVMFANIDSYIYMHYHDISWQYSRLSAVSPKRLEMNDMFGEGYS